MPNRIKPRPTKRKRKRNLNRQRSKVLNLPTNIWQQYINLTHTKDDSSSNANPETDIFIDVINVETEDSNDYEVLGNQGLINGIADDEFMQDLSLLDCSSTSLSDITTSLITENSDKITETQDNTSLLNNIDEPFNNVASYLVIKSTSEKADVDTSTKLQEEEMIPFEQKVLKDVSKDIDMAETDLVSDKNNLTDTDKEKQEFITDNVLPDIPKNIEIKKDTFLKENKLTKTESIKTNSLQDNKIVNTKIIKKNKKASTVNKVSKIKKTDVTKDIEKTSHCFNETVENSSLLKNINFGKKKESLRKLLSIKIDNSYSIQYNCLFLSKKVDQFVQMQNNILIKLRSLNKFTTKCLSSHFLKELNSVQKQVKSTLKLLGTQEYTLNNLQKKLQEILLTVSLSTHPNIEETNISSIPSSLEVNENSMKILKKKNCFLEQQLKKLKSKLINIKKMYKTNLDSKDKYLLQLKKKLLLAKHRIKIIADKKSIEDTNIRSVQFHQQLQYLMMSTNSLMINVMNHMQNSPSDTEQIPENSKNTIKELNCKVKCLKSENSQKDDIIRKLIKEKNHTTRQSKIMQQDHQKEIKQKDFEIKLLKSTVKCLKQRENRWLTDRFHLQCHSMMLMEKLRQSELNNQLTH